MPVPLALTVPRRPGRQILAQCDTCGLIVALPDRLSDGHVGDLDPGLAELLASDPGGPDLGRCPWCRDRGSWNRQDFDSTVIDTITVTVVEPSTVGLGSRSAAGR